MSRKSGTSPVAVAAQARLDALKSLDPNLDLGYGLTLTAYQALINNAQAKLSAYNTLLSQVGDAQNALRAAEQELRPFSARLLTGVATKYGKDSSQYEMAGGTRTSEIKRMARKTKTPPAATS
ncbi:MAG: hypothetical protein WA821_23190 [Anaerolineales bacterium]